MIKKSLRAYITCRQLVFFILSDCKVVRVLLFQLLKQQVNRIFEILIIFPCFTGIYQINQYGKILFLLRCFVPDICDQGCIIELFRL